MKNKIILIFLSILLVCCDTKKTRTSSALNEYKIFVSTLDSTNLETTTTAAKKFIELFKSETDTCVRDSGFILFDNYYTQICNNLNDTSNKNLSDSLIMRDTLGNQISVSEKLKNYEILLKNNGFEVASAEGMAYIKQNRELIANYFYNYVSTPMKKYLIEVNKETKEGFSEDAGLVIEPKAYVDRLIFWENFLRENPNFIYQNLIEEKQKWLLTFFLYGMENAPVMWNNAEEGNSLNGYYKTAYSYLENSYPISETNKIVNPYFKFLLQNQENKADSIRKCYEIKKLIYNPYK